MKNHLDRWVICESEDELASKIDKTLEAINLSWRNSARYSILTLNSIFVHVTRIEFVEICVQIKLKTIIDLTKLKMNSKP
jgi:hypothetical protein